eukprot:6177016-Pleurochrysis_carterae.AAC.1
MCIRVCASASAHVSACTCKNTGVVNSFAQECAPLRLGGRVFAYASGFVWEMNVERRLGVRACACVHVRVFHANVCKS